MTQQQPSIARKRKFTVQVLFRLRSLLNRLHLFIRLRYYKALGASIGKNVKLGAVYMTVPEQVIIGNGCDIEDEVRFRIGGLWKQSSISIGKSTFIGHSTQINVRGNFKIGNKCLIAPMCIFSDAHHGFTDLDVPIQNQVTTSLPIEVEDNVWIGSGVIILGGVTIHSGAVIAAGAVVNKSVPAYEVWGGVPARKIKSRLQ